MIPRFHLKGNKNLYSLGIKMRLLRKCKCRYTIDQSLKVCNECGNEFYTAHPPKFSLHDKYADYRRKMKEIAKQRGLL
ncbi:MAG: nucleolar RNA-binding Nop10p family protein [Candidatus Hodarchaeota archaeon]